jgi:phage gp36-like protein
MAYATLQDMATRFGAEELTQLTDRANVDAIDSAPVNAALGDADALIDGYLAQRYAVPVVPTPPMLRRLACDITRFLLSGEAASQAVRSAYEEALAQLRDLSAGRAALPGAAAAAPGATPAAGGAGRVQVAAAARRLDSASLSDYLA